MNITNAEDAEDTKELKRTRASAFHLPGLCVLRGLCVLAFSLLLVSSAYAADLTPPPHPIAGTAISIPTAGTGEATFYVAGPSARIRGKVRLGEPIALKPEDTHEAGRYVVILHSSDGDTAKAFFISAAEPANINFLAQPSRVPAAKRNAITGTAFVFDGFHNLVLAPQTVNFELSVADSAPVKGSVTSHDGVAWTRMDSSRRAGAAQFVVSTGDASVRRVVQQVAADPCNLRMHVQPAKNGIVAETDPVRDCSGNPVPDGTIVTFTEATPTGKSTVDARIKKGIARAEFPAASNANLSVAAGVVMGNEIHLGGGR